MPQHSPCPTGRIGEEPANTVHTTCVPLNVSVGLSNSLYPQLSHTSHTSNRQRSEPIQEKWKGCCVLLEDSEADWSDRLRPWISTRHHLSFFKKNFCIYVLQQEFRGSIRTQTFAMLYICDDTLIFIWIRGSLNIKNQTDRLAYKEIRLNK
jgi:hypothetical protein